MSAKYFLQDWARHVPDIKDDPKDGHSGVAAADTKRRCWPCIFLLRAEDELPPILVLHKTQLLIFFKLIICQIIQDR